ncbi:MAG: tetratricopeptide repeat protein [Phycisphaerae bacterium]|nr:tetratricopeptide repeat protein [Phycisphaerae bacterium]
MFSNFFKKKPEASDGTPPPPAGKSTAGAFEPDPERAAKWFNHGRVAIAQQNYPYAMLCFAMGIRLDPFNMPAHESMYEAGVQHFNTGGKPAKREDAKKVQGPGPVDRFAAAEFVWMHDLNNLSLTLEVLEAAGLIGQMAFGKWIAPSVINRMRRQQVKKKGPWVTAKDHFMKLECWNEAFAAAEAALEIDPADSKLANQIKELQAQQAIERGGFNAAPTDSGDFRRNIKDADKQRTLDEQGSISGGADVEERNFERAKKELEENPMSADAISKYGQALKRRATPESEELAHSVYMTGYERLGEYRFRVQAGDIRISQLRRRAVAAKEQLDATPTDLVLQTEYEERLRELREVEGAEFRERVAKYPTDRGMKIDLGRIEFDLGNYEDAMPLFQSAKEESKSRVRATFMLGRCFAAMGWHSEAIQEFRDALQSIDSTVKDVEIDIRYEMMTSLMALAVAENSPAAAKEAFEICSAIVRANIGYRDIRDKRKEIDQLRKDLGG